MVMAVPLPTVLVATTVPARLVGKAVDLRQSETGAFAERLGGEERLEDSRQHVGRDADAGIGHRQRHEVALELIHPVALLQGDVARRQRNDAAARHRVTRVDGHVDQRELELGDVDLDRPDIRRDVALELHVAAQRADQHLVHGLDAFLEVGDHRVERLASRERQQLARQALAAIGGRVDRVDRLQMLRIGEPAAQKLRMAADDHQEIVEVVRDAAGQLAERLHLLRLRELLLRPLERRLRFPPLGDVARDVHEADQRADLVADRLDHGARPELALVAPHAPALDGIFALVGGDLERARRLAALLLLLGIEAAEVLADDFRRRVLVDALRAHVPVGDVAVAIEHEDRVIGDALDDHAKAPLAFDQRLLRLAPLGDVVLAARLRRACVCSISVCSTSLACLEGRGALFQRLLQVVMRALQIFLGAGDGR